MMLFFCIVVFVLLLVVIVIQVQVQICMLYVGMNGGNMEKIFMQVVFGFFEQKYNVKIVVVFGGLVDILVKVQVVKDKLQMYLMFLDDGVMYCVVGMGLCEKQKFNFNLVNLLLVVYIKDDLVIGVIISVIGLVYNIKVYVEKGWVLLILWFDLVDFKFKGCVVFQLLFLFIFGLYVFFVFNQLKGGMDVNVDFGFKVWFFIIGFNVLEYIFNLVKIFEMVQIGEVVLFFYMFM